MSIYKERLEQYPDEKRLIGSYVAYYLRKYGSFKSIAIDGGTSNICVIQGICREVQKGHPTVSHILTNHLEGIYFVHELSEDRGPVWRCTGGVLRPSRETFVEGAEDAIRASRFWAAIIGINGFDPPYLYTNTRREHTVKLAMINEARVVIFPIDSSKWIKAAADKLTTLHDIVDKDKKVVLVSSCPIRQQDESNQDLAKRSENFLNAVYSFIELWGLSKQAIQVWSAAFEVDSENTDEKSMRLENLISDLRSAIKNVGKSQSSQKGLIVRFDLGNVC